MTIKKVALLLITVFSLAVVQAQTSGMKFEHNSTWKDILAKAKAENKYIFVDCYTTWCGPCRYMSANIFPLDEVGGFYNDKFINAKFQLDSTSRDNDDIKALYADAAFLMREYKIRSFPTYLFFNSDGQLVHRDGGSCEAKDFIQKGASALNPEKQYYTQLRKFEGGERNVDFLRNLSLLAIMSRDEATLSKISNAFMSTNPDLLDKDNLQFVYQNTRSVKDTGFTLMMNNLSKFESIIDKNELHANLKSIILRSEVAKNNPAWRSWDKRQWDSYSKALTQRYPVFAQDVIFNIKTTLARSSNNWTEYATEIETYLTKNSLRDEQLNEYAWTVFENCNDMKIVEKASVWSKKSISDKEKMNPEYIDTYANLLYKLGKNKEALEWEEKAQAIAIESGAEKTWGQEAIDKMKRGEKTW